MKKFSNADKKGFVIIGISIVCLLVSLETAYLIDRTGISKEWFLVVSMSCSGVGFLCYPIITYLLRL